MTEPTNPYAGTPQPLGSWGEPPLPLGHPSAPPEHPQATTVLVLGVLGLLVVVTGPFAWMIGNRARAEVATGRYAPSGTLTAGWVLGIITSVYLAIIVLGFGLVIAGLMVFRA